MKKWIIGTLTAAVAMFVVNLALGVLGIGLLAAPLVAAFTAASIAVHVFVGAVLATALGWRGTQGAVDAAKAGAVIGILVGVAAAIGNSGFGVMGLIGAILTGTIVYGIAGALVATVVTAAADESR